MRLVICAIFLFIHLSRASSFASLSEVPTGSESSYPRIILNMMNRVPRWTPSFVASEDCKKNIEQPLLDEKRCRADYNLNFFDSYRSKIFFFFKADETGELKEVDFPVKPGVVIEPSNTLTCA